MWKEILLQTGPLSLTAIFLYGCVSSLHCIGMCGGIIMSVTVSEGRGDRLALGKQAAYHGGRLLAGLCWGILLGLTGQWFSLNPYFKSLIPVVCGGVMLFMGLVHLGAMSRLPIPAFRRLLDRLYGRIGRKGALSAGLLTGLLPCGAMQTAQVYAAGSASLWEAAACMLFFIAGTIPMLLAFGICHAAVTGTARRVTVKLSGAITILLGLRLILRALSA